MAAKRIYAITNPGNEVMALVQAGTKAQALAHYARRVYDCAVAVPDQLIHATKKGIEVEQAGEEARE